MGLHTLHEARVSQPSSWSELVTLPPDDCSVIEDRTLNLGPVDRHRALRKSGISSTIEPRRTRPHPRRSAARRSWLSYFVVVPSVFLSACGTTAITESHIFQTQRGGGDIAYYRVTINADADLAKTSYRAGLYDAAALDAILGGVTSDDTTSVDAALEKARCDAIKKLADAYYKALAAEPPNADNVRAKELALRTALEPVPRRQKFAIIFSALASVVEEAIAGIVEEQDTTKTINAAISGLKRDTYIQVKAEGDALAPSVAQLRGIAETLNKVTISGAADLESYRSILGELVLLRVP